jgi:hypothetical protein
MDKGNNEEAPREEMRPSDEDLRSRRRIAAELKVLRGSLGQELGPLADTTAVLRQRRASWWPPLPTAKRKDQP